MSTIGHTSPDGEIFKTPREVSEEKGITTGYLAACRCVKGHALKFIKVGKNVFYREADVDAYFDSRKKAAK